MKMFKTILIVAVAVTVMVSLGLWSLVHYGSRYFAPEEIENMPLPGDDLLLPKDRQIQQTLVITINAPPTKVWPYLKQMGQDKAGFYSFDWLERVFTFDIHNTNEIKEKWQDLKPGQWMYYHQKGIGSEVMEVAENKYLTMRSDSRKPPEQGNAFALNPIPGGEFAWTWNFILQELPGGKTRFIERCAAHFAPDNFLTRHLLVKVVLGVPSIVMCTKQMEVIKACAEGHPPR
jgi:hypothetical protein